MRGFIIGLAALAAPGLALSGCRYKVFSHGELDRGAVRRVLARVVKVRGLSPRRPIKIRVISATALRREIDDELREYSSSGKLAARKEILQGLHLLGDEARLGDAYRRLFGEVPLGYYDSGSKRLRVVYKPVMRSEIMELISFFRQRDGIYGELMAHELTHALVDQHVDLEKFAKERGNEDETLARKSLVEGDATLTGFIVGNLLFSSFSSFLKFARRSLGAESGFSSAPAYLKASFSFPYTYGSVFTAALYKKGGFPLVDRAYRDPPRSTEQIMYPQKYLGPKRDHPVPVPGFGLEKTFGVGWKLLYASTLGEFQTRVMLARWFGGKKARAGAAGWGGDRAELWKRSADGRLVLLWVSVWDTPGDAAELAGLLRLALRKKIAPEARAVPSPAPGPGAKLELVGKSGRYGLFRRGARVVLAERVPPKLWPVVRAKLIGAPRAAPTSPPRRPPPRKVRPAPARKARPAPPRRTR